MTIKLIILALLTTLLSASEFNVNEVKKYIYKIEVVNKNDIKGIGSAVALSSNGKLITAYHGIKSIKSIKAIDYLGNSFPVTLGKISAKNDLAYLHIDTTDIPFAKIAIQDTKWSEEVYIINSASLLLKGIVSKLEPHGIIVNVEISVGTSGGGVFNNKNELIAIALRKDILNKTSYAVSTKELATVVDDYAEYKELKSLEGNNYDYSYCNDKDDLTTWDKFSKSKNVDIQEFHALFLGLCEKVKRKDLTTEKAQFIFEQTKSRLFGE